MATLQAPTIYRSSDASAPTLTGQAGSLINLLDKCLVTGYGSKAAAGWTKPFSDVPTNRASFRSNGGNRFYLDVNDNGPGVGTFKEARLSGFEVMTAVATGTGQFPTTAQMANSEIMRKSTTADATTRTWCMFADDRTFYLLNQAGDTAGVWNCFIFGDFFSYVAGTDNYRTIIIGRNAENVGTAAPEVSDLLLGTTQGVSSAHYAPRAYTGLGGSLQVGKLGDFAKATQAANLSGGMAMPNPIDGQVWLAPVFVCEVNQKAVRGKLRGFMHFLHLIASVADQDTIAGTGVYAGRTFQIFKSSPNAGVYCLDTTAWDTN